MDPMEPHTALLSSMESHRAPQSPTKLQKAPQSLTESHEALLGPAGASASSAPVHSTRMVPLGADPCVGRVTLSLQPPRGPWAGSAGTGTSRLT